MRDPAFPHRHLLGIEGLSPLEINHLLDLSDRYVELNRGADKMSDALRGRTIVNLFFETSTRTRTTFELAAKRLSDMATPASLAPGANVAVTVRMRGTTSVSRIVTVT